MSAATKESPIPAFIQYYSTDYIFQCKDLASKVAVQCGVILAEHGIDYSVKWRAKDPNSLRDKLMELEIRKGEVYESLDNIQRDIIDYAGVRILVNFRRDMMKVAPLIRGAFMVQNEVSHPKKDQPGTYHAEHYHVCLTGDQTKKVVEIQVSLALRDPYHKLEHDILYKGKKKPKFREKQILNNAESTTNLNQQSLEQYREYQEYQAMKAMRLITIHNVEHYLRKWIDQSPTGWFKSIDVGSCSSLGGYLEKSGGVTIGHFEQLLKTNLEHGSESTYFEIAKLYQDRDLSLVIFLMDRLLLSGNVRYPTFSDQNIHQLHIYKINALTSTIGWLKSSSKKCLEWRMIFARSRDKISLRDGFLWLCGSQQAFLLSPNGSLDERDVAILEKLWTWFEEQSDRRFMLAFAISRFGVQRERAKIMSDIEDIICALTPLMKKKKRLEMNAETK